MSVTEDHRFWSITDDEWVELQELDPTDRLLTPDGATVTVDWLDWDAGVTAPAWDLTVAEEHNFFVAADGSAEPLLVHNATRKATCDLPFGPDQADILRAVGELPPDLRDGLETIVGDLTESGLPDADVIRFTDFASSNPERVRPQLEAWPEYVPLASASVFSVSTSRSPLLTRRWCCFRWGLRSCPVRVGAWCRSSCRTRLRSCLRRRLRSGI